MRWVSVFKMAVIAGVVAAAVTIASNPSVTGQARTPGLPRLNGKPDMNGLWQTINTANWDIQAHSAKPALAMRPGPVVPVPAREVVAFGAVGAIPSGLGVVDGNDLPYLPEALKKKEENQANWLSRDPEVKCYLPGVPRVQLAGRGDAADLASGDAHPRAPTEVQPLRERRRQWRGRP